mgnify:CR=1 FL=1
MQQPRTLISEARACGQVRFAGGSLHVTEASTSDKTDFIVQFHGRVLVLRADSEWECSRWISAFAEVAAQEVFSGHAAAASSLQGGKRKMDSLDSNMLLQERATKLSSPPSSLDSSLHSEHSSRFRSLDSSSHRWGSISSSQDGSVHGRPYSHDGSVHGTFHGSLPLDGTGTLSRGLSGLTERMRVLGEVSDAREGAEGPWQRSVFQGSAAISDNPQLLVNARMQAPCAAQDQGDEADDQFDVLPREGILMPMPSIARQQMEAVLSVKQTFTLEKQLQRFTQQGIESSGAEDQAVIQAGKQAIELCLRYLSNKLLSLDRLSSIRDRNLQSNSLVASEVLTMAWQEFLCRNSQGSVKIGPCTSAHLTSSVLRSIILKHEMAEREWPTVFADDSLDGMQLCRVVTSEMISMFLPFVECAQEAEMLQPALLPILLLIDSLESC